MSGADDDEYSLRDILNGSRYPSRDIRPTDSEGYDAGGAGADIKRPNNIIVRGANRQEQMVKAEILYMALKFVEKILRSVQGFGQPAVCRNGKSEVENMILQQTEIQANNRHG